jgi:hypothetical protein
MMFAMLLQFQIDTFTVDYLFRIQEKYTTDIHIVIAFDVGTLVPFTFSVQA